MIRYGLHGECVRRHSKLCASLLIEQEENMQSFLSFWQVTAQFQEMAEDTAADVFEGAEEVMDGATEGGVGTAHLAVLGVGGGIAGAAAYTGAQALRAKPNKNSDDPNVANIKLKLSVSCTAFICIRFWQL